MTVASRHPHSQQGFASSIRVSKGADFPDTDLVLIGADFNLGDAVMPYTPAANAVQDSGRKVAFLHRENLSSLDVLGNP